MTVYILAKDVAAVQTIANVNKIDGTGGPNQLVRPAGDDNPNAAAVPTTAQLTVTGSGAVSASAQIVGSNDGQIFVLVGSAIAASSALSQSTAGQTSTDAYAYWGAYITAISGTNARATVTLSA